MPDLVTNDLIQAAAVGVPHALLGGLLGGDARKVAGSSLSVHVLSVLKSTIKSGYHGDVVLVLQQRLHGGGKFERVDSGLVEDSLVVLKLVGILSFGVYSRSISSGAFRPIIF